MSIYQLARLTCLQTEGAMGYKIPDRCARATWRNCSSAWRHQCASSHWISCVGQHATHQKRCQHLLTLKKEHLRGNKSIARKKFWKPSLFGLRKFWWYQARFSKVACNYKKKNKTCICAKVSWSYQGNDLGSILIRIEGDGALYNLNFILQMSQDTGVFTYQAEYLVRGFEVGIAALYFSEHHRNVSRP